MAVTPTGVYFQVMQSFIASINNAAAQTKQTVVTPGTNGTRVVHLFASSTDTSARDLVIGITRSATSYDIGIVTIPITAGTVNSVPTVDLLNATNFAGLPLDAYGNPYIDLKSGDVLYVYAATTVTTAKQINIFGFGGDL